MASFDVVDRLKFRARLVPGLILLAAYAVPAHASVFDRPFFAPRYSVEPAEPDEAAKPAKPRSHKVKRNDAETGKFAEPTGPLTIVVSIAKQRVTLFSDGKEIAQAPVSTGTAGHETPMGIFAVISKARYHASNIYSGAPMPYMERITWSGIALHEGPLPGYAASHGCIRLPGHFAANLFKISRLGARVIIVRDPVAPVEIASPRLFVPKLADDKPKEITAAVQVADSSVQAVKSDSPVGENVAARFAVPAIVKLPDDKTASLPDAAKPIEPAKKKGPVQVFVSRKAGKLYVRQDFQPLFEAPVAIPDADKPWGTHVFTAMAIKDNKEVRWTAVTVPSGVASKAERGRKLSQKETERRDRLASDLAHAPSAAEALERFEMPKEAVERISELLAVGSSLIVSDNPLSDETGLETDFVVATH